MSEQLDNQGDPASPSGSSPSGSSPLRGLAASHSIPIALVRRLAELDGLLVPDHSHYWPAIGEGQRLGIVSAKSESAQGLLWRIWLTDLGRAALSQARGETP